VGLNYLYHILSALPIKIKCPAQLRNRRWRMEEIRARKPHEASLLYNIIITSNRIERGQSMQSEKKVETGAKK